MADTCVWVVLLALATSAVVDVWFNASLFADVRDWLSLQLDRLLSCEPTLGVRAGLFVLALLRCPYCLTVWVAAGLQALNLCLPVFFQVVTILAAVRVCQLINSLLPKGERFERAEFPATEIPAAAVPAGNWRDHDDASSAAEYVDRPPPTADTAGSRDETGGCGDASSAGDRPPAETHDATRRRHTPVDAGSDRPLGRGIPDPERSTRVPQTGPSRGLRLFSDDS